MIRVSVSRAMDSTTQRLLRELPGTVRSALQDGVPALEDAAAAGLSSVEPRADGSPALLGLVDNLHAEVRDGRRGPVLVLTADGRDPRGIPYARVLNVHAHGVRVVSKADMRRKREAKAREREERARQREQQSPEARQRAAARTQARATAKANAAAARDMRLMRGDSEEHAKQRAREAAAAARRAERAARKKPGGANAWRIPPRNPMTAAARAFEQELLRIIVARVNQRWR